MFRVWQWRSGSGSCEDVVPLGMTQTPTPPPTRRDDGAGSESHVRRLVGRITPLEIIVAGVIAAIMLLLVVIEPDILEAPFENERTILFTVGGTAVAAVAYVVMLWFRVPPVARVIVLVIPFVIVNWWLISPYFVDDVVDDDFSASISEEAPSPDGPVLLGSGQFVGLAGHAGTGDAGIFQNPDGSLVLRFENFDIDNGPDLEVYLVPGAGQASPAPGSIHLGPLEGNIGDQNYDLPPGTELAPGSYTALVWCEAFSVEFVGASIDL